MEAMDNNPNYQITFSSRNVLWRSDQNLSVGRVRHWIQSLREPIQIIKILIETLQKSYLDGSSLWRRFLVLKNEKKVAKSHLISIECCSDHKARKTHITE